MNERALMQRALFHAARGQGRTAPNPMVGAVVVSREGVVVGQGAHEVAGGPHAEVHALDEAGAQARGGTLFVTLEPCCHVGRTGPCTARVIEAGIARVVAAMLDPNPVVNGKGAETLRAHGIQVDVGLEREAAERLNTAFIRAHTAALPLVILKAAASSDGFIAARRGLRTQISGPHAARRTHRLRASVDAVAVGSETVLVDNPLLTVRECFRERPLARVVFDRRLRTPPTAGIFQTVACGPVIIVTSTGAGAGLQPAVQALTAAGAEVVAAGETLAAQVAALGARGVGSLLVEGGAQLQAAFWNAGLVQRLHLIVGPDALGAQGVPLMDGASYRSNRLERVLVEPCGRDVWVEADVHRNR